MKICILTPRFPFPEIAGDVLRINSICRYLKNKGHTVILVTFFDKSNNENNKIYANNIYDKVYYIKRRFFVSCLFSILALIFNKPIQVGYYFSFTYLSVLKKVIKIEKPELYIVQLLRMVAYANLLHLQNKTIVDIADALSKTYNLANKPSEFSLKKWIYRIEKSRITRHEKQTIYTYKKCVLNTQADKIYLGNYKSLFVYPMGVNCLEKIPFDYKNNKIVFIGNMRTLQNQDAILYFVNDIFPLIKKEFPETVFHIIGAEPPVNIKKLSDGKNIIVSGFVPSVEDEIKDAAVAVAPVRIAAGIQNKVLISMACGVPVVLTSLISVGIPELVSNTNCIITDEKNNFAQAVISLMRNDNLRNNIGKEGYDMVLAEYSWNKKLEGYENLN